LGLEFQNWTALSPVQQSLCLSQAYGLYPLEQTCFVMIFLYFIRYFSIIRVNSMKNNVRVEEVDGEQVLQVAWYVRLLKLMSNLWFVMLLAFFYFIIALIINTIVMVGTNGEFLCEFQTLVNLRIVNAVQLIVVYVLTILLLFGDVLGNLKMLSHCEIYNYVFKKDPFYFRVQIALFVPYMLYDLAAELYFLIVIQSFPDLIYTVVQTEALNTVNFDILLLIDVVLPLMLSIFTFIINLFLEEEPEKNDLDILLLSPSGRNAFEGFLQSEYAVENLYCWEDIQKFKNLKKDDAVLKTLANDSNKRQGYLAIHAKRICDKYFNGNKSLMEVNVQKKETDRIWGKLKQKHVDSETFDKILTTVKENLCDSYSRFYSTAAFRKYQKELEIEKALMEKDTQKKLGWFGYIRKLFGNFQRNVKRRASILRRPSSIIMDFNGSDAVKSSASSSSANMNTNISKVELLDISKMDDMNEHSSVGTIIVSDNNDNRQNPPEIRKIIVESTRKKKKIVESSLSAEVLVNSNLDLKDKISEI